MGVCCIVGFRDRSHNGPFRRATRATLAGATSALMFASCIATAIAQTSALIPNASQQFLDASGNPLAGGSVSFYVPGTTQSKTVWSDENESVPFSQPVTLDAGGFPQNGGASNVGIFGQGNYRQIVRDAQGNTIYDGFTSAYGSATPSGGNGTDTAPVGTVMPFSGFSVPTNWQLAFGQAISRTTYPQLLSAITIASTSANCVNTSTTVTGFTDTSQIPVGAPIESTCLPTGDTVASVVNATTITVSVAATATGTFTATVFPWGNGDGVSTFNVPDLRGRITAGADAMGGTSASRLTSTFYGSSAATPAVAGGAQSRMASTALVAGNIPQITFTPTGTIGGTQNLGPLWSNVGGLQVVTGSSPSSITDTNVIVNGSSFTFTGNATTIGNATPSAATSSAFATVQPTLTVNYIIKVTPNTTGAGGVTSLGGLFGDIATDTTLRAYVSGTTNTLGCVTATSSQIGCARPDNTSIMVSGGVLSAIANNLTVGVTSVAGGTSGILYNNSNVLGALNTTGSGNVVLSASPTLTGTLSFGTLSPSSLAASPTTVTGLTLNGSVSATNDYVPCYSATSGTIEKCTVGSIAGSTSSGVTSLNGLTGAISVAGGANVTVSASTPNVTVNVPTPGATTDIIYNNAGVLGANSAFTFNGTSAVTLNNNGSSTITANDSTNTRSAAIQSNQGGGFPALVLNNGTGSAWQEYIAANNAYWSLYNGSDRLTALANGRVGIGTTSAAGNLDVENGSNSATSCLNSVCTNAYTTVYNCTGSDTSALNTLIASGIHALTISGSCGVTTLNQLPQNFTLKGSNWSNDCISTSATTGTVIQASSGDVISDICFTSSVTRTANAMVRIGATVAAPAVNVALHHVYMHGTIFNGIEECDASYVHMEDLILVASGASANDGVLFGCPSGSTTIVNTETSLIDAVVQGFNRAGVEATAVGDVSLVRFEAFANSNGILTDPNGTAVTGNVIQLFTCTTCILDSNTSSGWLANATNGALIWTMKLVGGSWIASNSLWGIGAVTDTGNGSSINAFQIANTTIGANAFYGIVVQDNSTVFNMNIEGNEIAQNGVGHSGGGIYLGVGTSVFKITNNRIGAAAVFAANNASINCAGAGTTASEGIIALNDMAGNASSGTCGAWTFGIKANNINF